MTNDDDDELETLKEAREVFHLADMWVPFPFFSDSC